MRRTTITIAVTLGTIAMAGTAAAPASACSRHVVWRTIRDGTQACPRKHSFLAGSTWVRLHWRGWGSKVPRASGYEYDYPPATGTNGLSPLRLRLYARLQCSDGALIYSREAGVIHFNLPNYHHTFRFNYRIYCNGNTTSGGGG